MTFGAQLKKAREAKKLTQEQLGKGLGTGGKDLSKSVVHGWEKEKKPHYPRVDQLMLICSRLGCSADYLLFGTETAAKLSPESAQLAEQIDSFKGEVRSHIIRLCKETIRFAQGLNVETEPQADQAARKAG